MNSTRPGSDHGQLVRLPPLNWRRSETRYVSVISYFPTSITQVTSLATTQWRSLLLLPLLLCSRSHFPFSPRRYILCPQMPLFAHLLHAATSLVNRFLSSRVDNTRTYPLYPLGHPRLVQGGKTPCRLRTRRPLVDEGDEDGR